MHTSTAALALVQDAVVSGGDPRAFLMMDSELQTVVSLPALRDVTGASAAQTFLEYDSIPPKRQQHLCVELHVAHDTQHVQLQLHQDLVEPDLAASTLAFNGQVYYLQDLASLIILARRLMGAVPSCADSKASLRKALHMIRHLSDNTFLWGDCLVCSFEELAALATDKLTYKAWQLHEPSWTDRPQDLPTHWQAMHQFQEKVMRGAKALLNHLVASQFEQGQRGRRFYRALFDMADKVIGVSAEAKASFMSIQLLCTMVSKELQVHVWEALKEYGCLPVDEPEHKEQEQQSGQDASSEENESSDENDHSDEVSPQSRGAQLRSLLGTKLCNYSPPTGDAESVE